MNDFEREFYETEQFWSGDVLQDEKNLRRIEFTAAAIPPMCSSVVDVGSGNGALVNYLAENPGRLTRIAGVDRSRTALARVKGEAHEADISHLPFADGEFDCVTCCEVIEHLPQKTFEAALDEIARVARSSVVITVPFNEDMADAQTRCPKCETIFNANLHLRSFDRAKMDLLLASRGFNCIETQVFFPFKRNIGALRLYRMQNRRRFNSPICPVCGFENHDFVAWSPSVMEEYVNAPGVLNRLKQTLKKIWPKENVPGDWILAVYRRGG